MQRCHTYKIAVSKIFNENWGVGGVRVGGQDGCERIIKALGVRMDVNEELKFL